ncbi:MAG: aldo/keto reductase [Thiobacillus sp.]|nr:aldo/keto reductase [Thiobacillus sp.]
MNERLALGTVQFGLEYGIANESGRVNQGEAGKILTEAAGRGMNLLDTAIGYGDSERVLGQVGVANWQIVSKLPSLPSECADVAGWVDEQVEGSLARLGVDRLYAVLLHRPDQLFDARGQQLLEALEHLKAQGRTEKIGVSIYAPDELVRLFDGMHFDLVQAPLNILDRRLVNSGWAQRLKRQGVELHARSVFLQGLLLLSASRRPVKFGRWHHIWTEWDRWLAEAGLTPLQACLRYALSVEEVDKVVVGVDSVAQLREILAAATDSLTSAPNWPQNIDIDLLNPARWNQL